MRSFAIINENGHTNRAIKILLTILVLLICVKPTSGQNFKGGFRVGITTSEVSGDNLSGPNRLGWFATAFASRQAYGLSDVILEIMYIQKGSRAIPKEKNNFREYSLFLQYVEIPLWYSLDISGYSSLTFVQKLKIKAGLSVSFLVGHNETDMGIPVVREADRGFNGTELNLLAGLSYSIFKNTQFTFGFSNSLTPIRPHYGRASTWYNRGQYNSVWTFGFAYVF